MNNIYKVIWSKAKNCYVVASEIARSHTKSATGSGKIGGVTRRSLLASLMALSLLCGGLGVASASLEVVDQSGTDGTVTIYTKDEVDKALDTKGAATDVETNKAAIADLKNAVGVAGSGLTKEVADQKAAIAANTKSIDTNKAAINSLKDDKLDKTVATSTFAAKTELDAKANTDLSNLTEAGKSAIKNTMSADMDSKADKTTVDAVAGKVTTLEGTVGDASNGLVREVAELKTQGNNLNNELGTKANKSDLEDATNRITTNETNITALQTKTQKIEHNVANDTTSVNGMKVGQQQVDMGGKNLTDVGSINGIDIGDTQVDMNGKNLTGVGTINGIDLGTKQKGNYISQDGSIWGNMMKVDDQVKTNAVAIAQEVTNRETAVTNAKTELEKKIQTNADNIKNNKDEIARVNGELVKTNDYFNAELGKTNDYFNAELSKTNNHFNTELGKTNAALQATNKRTAGIERTDTGVAADNQTVIEGKVHFDQNGNVSGVKDLQTDTIHATGKVSAGDVSTGTLETTGDATIDGNLDVTGTLNIKDVTAETIRISKSEDTIDYKSEGSIIGDGGNLSVSNKKTDKITNITEESQLNVNEKGTVNWATSTDNKTGNVTEGRSEVTADNIKNSVMKTEGGKTFGYEENITADGKVGTATDKEGNTSTTRQDSKGIYGYAKDKDGNKSYTKQEGNRIAESVIGQDGKQTKSEMTSTDITNTAKDGTITNTAKNVTNEGTESVTNKVGNNEVKVSTDSVDIKADKKITESVGTASRVVENDKITDKASDSTVTTENGKGTTFGKERSAGTTNIYGDSIKTGTINANDTTTAKLTAGAAAGAVGGRLTVDADGVKGSTSLVITLREAISWKIP